MNAPPVTPSQTLSHYELLERIAEGGMGVVYKARDVKLDRLVALKLLSPALRASKQQVERLFQEARAISRLNHPHVATIYEVDEAGEEPFMALEYLPGGTLRDKIREAQANGGRLSARQVVDYGIQVADGLAHAHRHGIIHRDVKSDNALLTAEGEVKLTDFGLALVAGWKRPDSEDLTAGTAAYMSPEQAQGLEVDHRSDMFSFGVVLFELAASQVPFPGSQEAVILYDIVHTPAPPLRQFRDDIPKRFQSIVSRLMAKKPEERYANMDEVLASLRSVKAELSTGKTKPRTVQALEPTIAVLPFVDMSPGKDQEYFCDGITEEIINALTGVKGLKVVSRTSSFRFKGAAYDIREIGRQLGVQTVLEGSVRKAGDLLRITAQHISVSDGYHLWSQRFDRRVTDIFAIQDEIAQAIVENLRVKLVGERPQQLVKKRTENLEAYNLYLRGRYHLNQRTEAEVNRAIECFEQACCEDCKFALPYAGLAEARVLLGSAGHTAVKASEEFSKAREAALEAIRQDDTCAEAHTALALVYFRADWNWDKAEQEFRRAIELNDGYATAHHQYAMFLAAVKRLDQALEEIMRAYELDPLSPIISTAVGRILDFSGRFDEAIEQCRNTIALNPQFAPAYFDLGVACIHKKAYDDAIAACKKLGELAGERVREKTLLACVYADRGERAKALELLEELSGLAETRQIALVNVAIVHIWLGNLDAAFEALEKCYESRQSALVYLQAEAAFDPIRSDPRYQELIRKIGFPAAV